MSNNVDLLSPPLTHGTQLSPSVCTCYRYSEWCSAVSFSSPLFRLVPLRSENQVTFKTSLQLKQVGGAADDAFYLRRRTYLSQKMYEPVCLVCVSPKKKRREKEIESGQKRLDDTSRPVRFSTHTSPLCISDTGRHFSALHTYFYIYLFCMDMYCCMCRVASRRCCVHLFLACGCLCVTVSAAHATSLCLPGLVHCTIFHIPTHISTHAHIHPMSVC